MSLMVLRATDNVAFEAKVSAVNVTRGGPEHRQARYAAPSRWMPPPRRGKTDPSTNDARLRYFIAFFDSGEFTKASVVLDVT